MLVAARGADKLRQLLLQQNIRPWGTAASAGEARRMLAGGAPALTVINAPLPDETGVELAMELAGATPSGVLLLVKAELMSMVYGPASEAGVLTVSKPLNPLLFEQAVLLGRAMHSRLRRLEDENAKLARRLEDMRVIDRAKCLLIERMRITETEAHRAIEKQAMDTRQSRAQVARGILGKYEL